MQDLIDFKLIEMAYKYRGYPKGARRIYMTLLHRGICFNLKKIRRLMKKFGLECEIRQKKPYRKALRENHESKVAPNLVDRDFFSQGPRRILLTDITYLHYGSEVAYLSTILDAFTREILAYKVSDSLEVAFVLETVSSLVEEYGCELDETTIIHSDQGSHYTSKQFIQKLYDESFVQSMSRKGNCWDNAPQESFFGHMKDEIRTLVFEANSIEVVRFIIDDWMDYYNNERYQWDLMKLSPSEYNLLVTTGFDPLAKYRN